MDDITLFLFALFTMILLFFATKYSYWKRKNVPSPTPVPLLGNYGDFFTMKKTIGETVQDIYNKFPDHPYVGAYFGTEPAFIPRDPEMIKTILAKEFHKFNGRLLVDHEYRDPSFTSNLFSTSGDSWKTLRQNLNPLFTTGKLKNFFGLLKEVADKLDKYTDSIYKKSNVVDVKDLATRFVLEAVGSTLFGFEFEAMVPEETFIKTVADRIELVTPSTFIRNNIREVCPNIYHLFSNKVPLFESFDKIFADLARQSFESRQHKPIGRNDLVDFLLKFKEQGHIEGDGLKDGLGESKRVKLEATNSMLESQVLVFFAAGFSTSSLTIGYTLYELAKNPVIQERLIDEIEKVLNECDDHLTYESMQKLRYLEQVMSETLRKYPVLGILTRECVMSHKLEDYDLRVEKGLRVHIPVYAIHHDPKYYPNPHVFDPERFSPENIRKRHPYTFLAFGEGQRICIGMRFAKIQVTLGLVRILRKYRLEPCSQTPCTIQYNPRSLSLNPSHPLYVKFTPRSMGSTKAIDSLDI